MILLIDNYDSFTYNLYQYIGEFSENIKVCRNDAITLDEINDLKPTHIIISPGPGHPTDAGICVELVKRFSGHIPILGICLGHQAIAEAYGANIGHALEIVHGKLSEIYSTKRKLFTDLPQKFQVVRYHSLAITNESLPDCLEVDAYTLDNQIMAISHKEYHTYGLQFHPESVLTEFGKELIHEFLKLNRDDDV